MKTLFTLSLSFLILTLFSQNIEFTDPNFKNLLLYGDEYGNGSLVQDVNGNEINLDTNNDGEISLTEASQVGLIIMVMNEGEPYWNNPMYSNLIVDGMENFTNLTYFGLNSGYIAQNIDINLSEFPNVRIFGCYGVNFNNSNLDFSSCPLLEQLHIENVLNVSAFNITNCINLNFLWLEIWGDISTPEYLSINELDLSQNINLNDIILLLNSNSSLNSIDLSNNPLMSIKIKVPFLESVNLKNNIPLSSTNWHNISNYDLGRINTSLNTLNICVDDFNIEHVTSNEVQKFIPYYPNDTIIENLYVNDYCSPLSDVLYSKIQGNVKMDTNNNGYDDADLAIPFQNFNFTLDGNSYTVFGNQEGHYSFIINSNYSSMSLAPVWNANLFSQSTPANYSNILPFAQEIFQNFSLTSAPDYHDVSIYGNSFSIIPGNNSIYYLKYYNNGNSIENGTITWQFPSDYSTILSTSEAPTSTSANTYTWSFSNLQPYESRTITITSNYNTPTDPNFPLNLNDDLNFVSNINIENTDANIEDNQFSNTEIVVNSYDPNDKTCLEGDKLPNDKIGEYLHYRIRFENLGTANAQTITVVDSIDVSKFDIATLKPLEGSHSFQTEIKVNVVKFTFANINLPFDDANNDGYLIFKIKTLESVSPESMVANQADIYFDYNFPVITNNEETLFSDLLSIDDVEVNSALVISPNPVKNVFKIHTEEEIKHIEIYDIQGRILQIINGHNSETYNVENLQKGVYMLKIKTVDNQYYNAKLIKQ